MSSNHSHHHGFSRSQVSASVPDIHRRIGPKSGGGAIRNRSLHNNDSRRNGRRRNGPYDRKKGDAFITTNNKPSSDERRIPPQKTDPTAYRQPKPIIAPSSSTTTTAQPPKSDRPKLNPSSPTQARRIHQRRRQILYGKNTAGYESYIAQIPKHKRRKYSVEHPSTPDYTANISTKRWQGLVNVWRRSLHKFDPPDLLVRQQQKGDGGIVLAPRPYMSKREEEMEQAKADGLQVAFGGICVGSTGDPGGFGVTIGREEDEVGRTMIGRNDEMTEEEEAYRTSCLWNEEKGEGEEEGFLEEEVGYDSDDDIL